MIKKCLKITSLFFLAVAVSVVSVLTVTPIMNSHAQTEHITPIDISNYYWVTNDDGENYRHSNSVQIGSMTGSNRYFFVPIPGAPSFSNEDIEPWGGMEPTDGIINSAKIDSQNGVMTLKAGFDLTKYAGQTAAITVSKSGIYVTDNPGNVSGIQSSTFTLTIYVHILEELNPDVDSLSMEWQNTDNGRTFEINPEAYEIGEGFTGRTISVALPRVGKNTFTEKDIQTLDSGSRGIVANASVNNAGTMLTITTGADLTPYRGITATIRLSRDEYNDAGILCVYAFTIRIKVSHMSEVRINGHGCGQVITVPANMASSVYVTGIPNLADTYIVWCINANGVPVSGNAVYPHLLKDGRIDFSSLGKGTYYLYFNTGDEAIRSDVFTVSIGENSPSPAAGANEIYRLYNWRSGEHLYTTDANELRTLVASSNWAQEKSLGFSEGSIPIFRLYNRYTKEHLYTPDTNEINVLLATEHWEYDNAGQPVFYGSPTGTVPVYRLYNHKLSPIAAHHYSTDIEECRTLTTHNNFIYDNKGNPMYYLE